MALATGYSSSYGQTGYSTHMHLDTRPSLQVSNLGSEKQKIGNAFWEVGMVANNYQSRSAFL